MFSSSGRFKNSISLAQFFMSAAHGEMHPSVVRDGLSDGAAQLSWNVKGWPVVALYIFFAIALDISQISQI